MRNNYIVSFIAFFILTTSFIFSQLDFGANYELKYSNGNDKDGNSLNIFENYLDMNFYYNNWYFYSLLRYKNPALVGINTNKLEDIYDIFYLEYYNDNLQIQIGDLFQSYGAGLSMHTYEDRTIDYNNAVRGISTIYYLNDSLDLFSMLGYNTFYSRTSPGSIEPDIFIDNEIALIGANYQNDYFDIHYLTQFNNQSLNSATITNMMNLSNILGDYLNDRYPPLSSGPSDFNMKVLEHNLGSTIYINDLEFYFEKSWIYHNKIEAERVLGDRIYFSSYFSVNDYGFLYEYKDYNTPYYFSVYSNPPIVFRENPSTLISRNLHNVDFSNEVGHHILINKSYSDQLNVLISSACAYSHSINNNLLEPDLGQIFSDMLFQNGNMQEYESLKPYRQLYFEINGWTEDDNLFYKVGVDRYLEYSLGKVTKAITIPTQFTLKLKNGNSLSAYLEHQTKKDILTFEKKEYVYFAPSYNHYGKWILSLFGDFEINDERYLGADITYYINDNNILSIFLGSQKGGLVCANGTCVMQPDFEEGFKITSRVLF